MSEETFQHRVSRIAREHNVSMREALRVATAMVRLERRRAAMEPKVSET